MITSDMTKGEALQQFFAGFGIPAYPATSVPDDATFPWLTYDLVIGGWESGETALTVNLWFYTESEAIPNAKAQEIADVIGLGGVTLPCQNGLIWLKRGSPWSQSLRDEANPNVKRRYLNITAEFLTVN